MPHLTSSSSSTSARAFLRIGLTGGIGAGKSTVADLWRERGVRVIDLDAYSRAVLDQPGAGVDEAVARFGHGILLPSGTVDRGALAAIVFHDDQARSDLEQIVLSRVWQRVDAEEQQAQDAGEKVVVHDSPLLFEKNQDSLFALIVAVLAPREHRIGRIVERRGKSRAYAESVMAAQVSDLERIRRADLLVMNNADHTTLRARALRVFEACERSAHVITA